VPTDCSDGRPSDTEELLGRHDYGVANEKEVSEEKQQPQQHQQSSSPNNTKNSVPNSEKTQLNFEEFECDLSVEGGVDIGGQERQEFSFTLYDFDGHGKITKDDIAGLVTTIYDTLGSSIKVPHYGSKTIKVKLTVSPDQRKKDVAQDTVTVGDETWGSNHRVKFKRDLNVTIRESRVPRRLHRRRRCSAGGTAPVSEEKYPNSCSSSCRSAASENNDDGAADISEDDNDDLPPDDIQLGSQHSTPKTSRESGRTHTRRYQQHGNGRYRHQHSVYCPGEQILPNCFNNLSFQTPRKQFDRGGPGEHRHSHHRHRHKLPQSRDYTNFSQDPHSNCYLDLAGFEPSRTYGKAHRCYYDEDCRYDKLLGAVVCASSKHAGMGYHQPCRTRGHHRSRSHDLSHAANSFQYHLLDTSNDSQHHRPFVDNGIPHGYQHTRLGHHARSKSHETEYGNVDQHRMPVYRHQDRKFPPIVLGHSSSPHHLKHRNREQDQARAMKQVVRWLEQEFSSKHKTVTQHEHHHVHEHIHHHYHHYQETP
ncbi:hypothetical protein L9F63_019403, partial [Diploptera punctata]